MAYTTPFGLHSQATRLSEDSSHGNATYKLRTGLSPSMVPLSRVLDFVLSPSMPRHTTRQDIPEGTLDFQPELFPLHSPLLRAVSYTHLDVYKRQVPYISRVKLTCLTTV